jgi:tRNA(Arg) A34 adenosine deaminase TadA
MTKDENFLGIAIEEAAASAARGEVPVGAVLLSADGAVLARDGNRILELRDPSAHAEILVLRAGAAILGSERLVGTTLYVSLEPCTMCAGAISLARVARLVYAASDPKGGAVENGVQFFGQATCHHRPLAERMEDNGRSGKLLKDFFQARRS